MKTIIFAGLVAFAMTSMAQGTAAPATAPAVTATETKAPAKKAVKAKKAKKPKAAVAQPAPAVVAAPAATPAVAVAPAAGTSTAAPAAAAAPTKKWGASITLNPSSDFSTPSAVGTLSTLAGSYKVTESWKAALKYTAESVAAESVEGQSREYIDSNNFRTAYIDVAASTSRPSVLGSDAISLAISVRETAKDALIVREGALLGMNRHIDVTAVAPFTITPKFTVSVLGQYRNMDTDDDRLDRVIVMPSASYAINDVVSVYQAAGYMNSTQAGWELRPRRERLLLETGVDIVPAKGLSINLNVNQDKILSSTRPGETVTDLSLYKPVDVTADQKAAGAKSFDAVTYEAIIAYSF